MSQSDESSRPPGGRHQDVDFFEELVTIIAMLHGMGQPAREFAVQSSVCRLGRFHGFNLSPLKSVTMGDAVLDFEKRTALRAGHPVAVQNSAWPLLCFFCMAPDVPVDWFRYRRLNGLGPVEEPRGAAVRTAVRRLRRAFGPTFIRTRKGTYLGPLSKLP